VYGGVNQRAHDGLIDWPVRGAMALGATGNPPSG
jgi:hypothetical protein